MFAESPGLNAVEHAVYDVWLKGCKQKSDVPPPEAGRAELRPFAAGTFRQRSRFPIARTMREGAAMTAIEKDLLALEKKFWTGDAKFYKRECRQVLPGRVRLTWPA